MIYENRVDFTFFSESNTPPPPPHGCQLFAAKGLGLVAMVGIHIAVLYNK